LIKAAALSRRGFLKAFLKHVSGHPSDELQQIRMEHAQRWLARTTYPLATIAQLCGYRSANNFWVAFRRFHGLSP
jgi:transcriptional regulator GlxA family with amidase domain